MQTSVLFLMQLYAVWAVVCAVVSLALAILYSASRVKNQADADQEKPPTTLEIAPASPLDTDSQIDALEQERKKLRKLSIAQKRKIQRRGTPATAEEERQIGNYQKVFRRLGRQLNDLRAEQMEKQSSDVGTDM